MTDHGVLFSAAMVNALLAGTKTQTRRLFTQRYCKVVCAGEQLNPIMPSQLTHWLSTATAVENLAPWLDISGRFAIRGPNNWQLDVTPKVGDRIWVRETCRAKELRSGRDVVEFMADKKFRQIPNTAEAADQWVKLNHYGQDRKGQIVPSIHMPRWASRITLTVTDVRVQRLHEITAGECRAEGHPVAKWVSKDPAVHDDAARDWYMDLWGKLHAKPGERWPDNPWVIALTFDVAHANIDNLPT